MVKQRNLKISISGVRGIIGDTFTPTIVVRFAQAFGTFTNGGKIVVGSDTRPSREMIKHAVISGLISTGCEIIDVGILPVPTVQFIVREVNADGGIMITASHNPIEWNALKFIGPTGTFLTQQQIDRVIDIYHQGSFLLKSSLEYKDVSYDDTIVDLYINKILTSVDSEKIKRRKFKVAIDSYNGAGSVITVKLLEKLGCEVIPINTDITKIFPRNPEPTPENLNQLCEVVKQTNADIGFAQDADADRLSIVSNEGVAIGEEYTLALAVKNVLSKTKEATVVVNLSTSKMIEDICAQYNAKCYRAKVGEINVVEKILKLNAIIGGEGNGGVIYPKVNPCRDSLCGISLILELLATTDLKLSDIIQQIPKYYMVKTKIALPSDRIFTVLNYFRKKFIDKEVNTEDGLRVNLTEGWIHLRPSNTEPIIRLVVETSSQEKTSMLVNHIFEEINMLTQK
ncbi:MAG: phosphoglucosamine mutase [Endomicrobia bacterium]|nr:phosphoglucosamine mutase [Endomicrobiia bacterium]